MCIVPPAPVLPSPAALDPQEHWPANALSINEQLLAVLATASGCPTDTAPLEQLQKKLSDLSFLHSALDCPIPLSVYEQV